MGKATQDLPALEKEDAVTLPGDLNDALPGEPKQVPQFVDVEDTSTVATGDTTAYDAPRPKQSESPPKGPVDLDMEEDSSSSRPPPQPTEDELDEKRSQIEPTPKDPEYVPEKEDAEDAEEVEEAPVPLTTVEALQEGAVGRSKVPDSTNIGKSLTPEYTDDPDVVSGQLRLEMAKPDKPKTPTPDPMFDMVDGLDDGGAVAIDEEKVAEEEEVEKHPIEKEIDHMFIQNTTRNNMLKII